MKTLDEVDMTSCHELPEGVTEFDTLPLDVVIETIEKLAVKNRMSRLQADALYYLKMYRSDQLQWEADREDWRDKWETYIEARERHLDAVKELKRNDPLSWSELKQMEGKPVWIESLKDGAVYEAGWYLIIMVDDSIPDIPDLGLVNANGEYSRLEIEWMNMGQWKAYRKERK